MKYLLLTIGLCVFCSPLKAAGLFEKDDVLEVTLTGPLNSLFQHKKDEKAFPFTLEVDGKKLQIMASARGNSRKKVCYFGPIKLQFDPPEGENSVFWDQKSLKLVTHCNKSSKAQDNIIEEFLAYRFFSLLSDASYRVRLLSINYIDTENRRSTRKPGFVIESTRHLASRNNARQVSLPAVSLRKMNDRQLALVYVFQYLVGNTDWSLVAGEGKDSCCHNGRLISKNDELLYVPYDFDLSGLVDASYAFPDPSLRIKKVTRRRYRGFCLDRPILASALQQVKSHEAGYYDMIDSLPQLSEPAKKKARRFLERFFEEASDEQKLLGSFERRCLD